MDIMDVAMIVIGAFVGGYLGWAIPDRLSRGTRREATAVAHELGDLLERLPMAGDVEALSAALRQEVETARQEAERHERRAKEYFDKIEGAVAEAKDWRERYWRMAGDHGSAQALMLRMLERQALVLRQHGLKTEDDAALRQLHEAFMGSHVSGRSTPDQLEPRTA